MFPDLMANLEKNYVCILGHGHWLFNVNIDHDLYLSVQQFSQLLGENRNRQKIVRIYVKTII